MSRSKRKSGPRAAPPSPPPSAPTKGLRKAIWAAGVLALLVAATLFIRSRRPGPVGGPPPSAQANLLLVTLDTTRADHLGSYGHDRARTRHLDRLAAEGVRFEKAFAAAPITLPSHATLFTGLYPFEHGVRNNGNFYLAERFDTLATVLKGQGYRTGAFVSSFILDRRYGLARGFDTYDDRMEGAQAQVVSLEAERRGDRTALALAHWLESTAPRPGPFFAWLHLYDPHEPYRPPPPFREAFADSPYDGEIAFTDAAVASILDTLGRLGQLDRTLVAVTADHGESLGEHGEETHSMFVYDGAIRVPLLLWRPGRLPAGRVIQDPVRATDLAPTILDLLGAPALKTGSGRSLVGLIDGTPTSPAPAVYSETLLPQFYMNWAPLRALRDGRFKLIDAPRPELYDLIDDPGESRNRYEDQPQTARALREGLARLTAGSPGAMNTGALDREALEKLAALGYLGAGSERTDDDAPRADPKDVIEVFNKLRRANSAVRDRRFAEALPILDVILQADPKNAFAQLVLGSAYMGMGNNAKAVEQYRRYIALVPSSAYAHQWMAICFLRLGDPAAALKEADAALVLDPRFSDARVLKAGVLAARGRYADAARELRTAIETDPAKPLVRLDLAKVLAEAGQTTEAKAEYARLLEVQPDFAPGLVGLGALQARAGSLEEASAAFRRALELDASLDDARFDLARVLEQQGRTDEARSEYQRLSQGTSTPAGVRDAARERLRRLK